ncbi:hypothetical protein JH06_4184 [Blastocystis sp. subtype 4]|uniref:hypothetical protein n=1 Tax=Blastocystis sp. subtype 4 TaxID=944170 RepID=UPI0007120268|nr:hypothetical protein JH06_4184 [Blastocystis sp. subtype 4]KNB42615.1 hypothetical protein JH06_4184 [Blastocystis sp. subtype 4]|eukprot:XP_014526058.1 hypothetical protein JH06_4184 [Blastocystis sp. subtype 4]
MQKKCKRQVKQVFQEVEYIGKYISETKASCQWVLAFPGAQQEKVSFTVQDSTISGKKEILRNGILIYSHVVSNHPRETLYHNAVYNMTLDYYSYYLQHVIHIQVLQKKGIFSKVLPRVFRLFVDGVSFDILPMFFQQDQQDGFLSTSCTPSGSPKNPISKITKYLLFGKTACLDYWKELLIDSLFSLVSLLSLVCATHLPLKSIVSTRFRCFSDETEEKRNRMKMQELMIEKLKKEAGATVVEIKDISYDAGYLLEMLVVSPKFRGMKLLQQHRLMNKVLSNELSILHGITFKCMTPEQYEAMEKK